MKTNIAPAPYKRQPGESGQAFAAFAKYRDMGPGRSLAAVGQTLGRSKTLMERWSARWSWVKRAAAFDDMLDRRRRRDASVAVRRAAMRQARAARGFLKAVADRLERFTPDDVARLTPGQIIRWFSTAVAVERQALGLDMPAPMQQAVEDAPAEESPEQVRVIEVIVSNRAEVERLRNSLADECQSPA